MKTHYEIVLLSYLSHSGAVFGPHCCRFVRLWPVLSDSGPFCWTLARFVGPWPVLSDSGPFCWALARFVRLWPVLLDPGPFCWTLARFVGPWPVYCGQEFGLASFFCRERDNCTPWHWMISRPDMWGEKETNRSFFTHTNERVPWSSGAWQSTLSANSSFFFIIP